MRSILVDKGFPGSLSASPTAAGKSFMYFYRIGGKLRRMTLRTYPANSNGFSPIWHRKKSVTDLRDRKKGASNNCL